MLTIADEHGGKLPNRVMMFADEIGTIPKIESMEMMFSAGRSRRISMVPTFRALRSWKRIMEKKVPVLSSITARIFCLEVLHQTQRAQKSYQKHWETERCCLVLYPEEKSDPSQSLQMMSRPLMAPEELKTLPKGEFHSC